MQERLRNMGMHLGLRIGVGIDIMRSGFIALQETRRLQQTSQLVFLDNAVELYETLDPQQQLLLVSAFEREIVSRMLAGLADKPLRQKERHLEEYSRLATGYQRRFEEHRREEHRYYGQMFTKLTNGLRVQIEEQSSEGSRS